MFTACQWRGIQVIWFVNVYRLPVVRDINYSVRKCFPVPLGAGNFFIGMGNVMEIVTGKSYHISDDFFVKVSDPMLMTNKEDGKYRPHFFFFKDAKTDGIYWAIPQSSRTLKYKEIVKKKIAKYGKCNTIIIGEFGGKENAFLIQNMFPITEKYVDHEHTIGGKSVKIHSSLSESIISNAKEVLALHRRGVNLIFPDVDRIYDLMADELSEKELCYTNSD